MSHFLHLECKRFFRGYGNGILTSYGLIISIIFYRQKFSSRGVLIKRSSENMQQTYMRKPMRKCDFKLRSFLLKSHFRLGVSLYIYYIFSEHIFIKTSLEKCIFIEIYLHLFPKMHTRILAKRDLLLSFRIYNFI